MPRARIALYGAGGSPYHHAAVLARAGHEAEFVFPADIAAGALGGFDAFVMPGGGYRAMFGQIEPLGAANARRLREYVRDGGMYIGCCAGSYDAATVAQSFVDLCPAQPEMCLLDATVWNEGGAEWGLRWPRRFGRVMVMSICSPSGPSRMSSKRAARRSVRFKDSLV